MKKLLIIGLLAFASSSVFAQDFASSYSSGKEHSTTSFVKETDNFVVTSGFYNAPKSSSIVKVVEPNYKKLQVTANSGSSTIKLSSNFEGTVLLSYIVTNAGGQVIANNEVKLPSGLQSHSLDMTDYQAGDYFITARVSSKVTKVQSNYSFKVEKK
jgi:hypothetical protein